MGLHRCELHDVSMNVSLVIVERDKVGSVTRHMVIVNPTSGSWSPWWTLVLQVCQWLELTSEIVILSHILTHKTTLITDFSGVVHNSSLHVFVICINFIDRLFTLFLIKSFVNISNFLVNHQFQITAQGKVLCSNLQLNLLIWPLAYNHHND